VVRGRRQHLARHAVFRDHAAGGPADDQPGLHEAAALDGANAWHRFWHVTWPLLMPVTLVVVVFSVIQTFSDFQLIYVLTGGGPANPPT
jgi:ABC-type sugar transport system permease subunit